MTPSYSPSASGSTASASDSERHSRKRAYPTTVYDGPEYEMYSYDNFAINDDDEWRSFEKQRYRKLAKTERSAKVHAFEQQQKAMYKMLTLTTGDDYEKEGNFVNIFHETLKATEEGTKVSGELTVADEEFAHEFFLVKKKVYDARIELEAARSNKDDVTTKLEVLKDKCADLQSTLKTARSEYHAVCTDPIPARAVGLLSSFGMTVLGDPATLAVAVANRFPHSILAPSLQQGLTQLASDPLASLVVAGAIGVGAALATKAASYLTRRASIRRAGIKLARTKASVTAERTRKRQLEADHSEAWSKHRRAMSKERICCQADKTGITYPNADDEEHEAEEEQVETEVTDDEEAWEEAEGDEEVVDGEVVDGYEAPASSEDEEEDDDDDEEAEGEEMEEGEQEMEEAEEQADEDEESDDAEDDEEGAEHDDDGEED